MTRMRNARPAANGTGGEQVGETTATVPAARRVRWCPPGGCYPDNRCRLHDGTDPVQIGDLFDQVLVQLVPRCCPDLQLVTAGGGR